jgi:hypothetical protein
VSEFAVLPGAFGFALVGYICFTMAIRFDSQGDRWDGLADVAGASLGRTCVMPFILFTAGTYIVLHVSPLPHVASRLPS